MKDTIKKKYTEMQVVQYIYIYIVLAGDEYKYYIVMTSRISIVFFADGREKTQWPFRSNLTVQTKFNPLKKKKKIIICRYACFM